eukprot:TRINITY_DN58855_c0_g1_i1.p1 TRINITY_DN58855_c0_g1~~TRINITY_DN58855_c0_g1_i1.p1  ORF type:complete len:410 (-),score=40.76 TRINITY_DN58855_c0_g1_i1:211-1440(-)
MCSKKSCGDILASSMMMAGAGYLGYVGSSSWTYSNWGLGAISWAAFLSYCVVDHCLPQHGSSSSKDVREDREMMYGFAMINNDFWDKCPLTSPSYRSSVYRSFTWICLKNLVNIAFLTSMWLSLQKYDRAVPNSLGRHVIVWLEVPLVYAYFAAWLWPFLLLVWHQHRTRNIPEMSHQLKNFGEAVRVTAQWFYWLGRMSSLNLLRSLNPVNLSIRLHLSSWPHRVRTVLQLIFCCLLGFMAFRIKVSQVGFLASEHLQEFSLIEWFKVLGFMNNIISMFDLRATRIAAKIQAYDLSENAWLSDLADHLARQHRAIGGFIRFATLKEEHVDALLYELAREEGLKLNVVPELRPWKFDSQRDFVDPALPPSLFQWVSEVFQAQAAIVEDANRHALTLRRAHLTEFISTSH